MLSPAKAARATAAPRRSPFGHVVIRGVRVEVCRDTTIAEKFYTPEEAELLHFVEQYTRLTGRKFPTYCEVLAILRALGYAKRPGGEKP